MANKQTSQLKVELPSVVPEPGMGTSMVSVRGALSMSEPPKREIRAIAEKMQIDVAKQEGSAIKAAHGARLVHSISLQTMQRFDEFVAVDRSIRSKQRPEQDQADIEVFCHAVRQAQATSLLAIRQAAAQSIETIILTPLDPPEERGEQVIVEQTPGLMGRLFGGQKVTRITR